MDQNDLTLDNIELLSWYRNLNTVQQIAIRAYLRGDSRLLAWTFPGLRQQSEQLFQIAPSLGHNKLLFDRRE